MGKWNVKMKWNFEEMDEKNWGNYRKIFEKIEKKKLGKWSEKIGEFGKIEKIGEFEKIEKIWEFEKIEEIVKKN